jgi:tRNA pseudouridine-54 N-methylase
MHTMTTEKTSQEKDEEIERLRAAIRRHRSQIKLREDGRRISSVAADRELWSLVDQQ